MRHIKAYKVFESSEELDILDIKNIFFSCYEEVFDRFGETTDTTKPRMEFLENGNLTERIRNNTFIIDFKESPQGIEMRVYTNGSWHLDLKEFEERIKPYKLNIMDNRPIMMLNYTVNGQSCSSLVREQLFIIK